MSAVEALAAALRERVLSGEIEPGTSLPEQEVAATYGVARPTVREAIAVLVIEGILRRERHRSAYVPTLTPDDVRDLLFVRLPLDRAVAYALAGRRVAVADDALSRLADLPDDAPWAAVVREHTALHEALVAAVASPRLERLYRALEAETQLGIAQLRRSYPDRGVLVTEHRALLAGIARGDASRAAAAHLETAWLGLGRSSP